MIARKPLAAALTAMGLFGAEVNAVSLDPDGIGQALIYPYYTVQFDGSGNSWNSYLSVVNRRSEAKVVRVRAREGRDGREVFSVNVYLAPNDVWTAAIVPRVDLDSTSPAVILTSDSSCTNPAMPSRGIDFSNRLYAGSHSDGLGSGLDRTREGYIEIIEMATLTGNAAQAVTQNDGVPENCEAVRGDNVTLAGMTAPPTGGLSGTITLINVSNGMDAGMGAVALAGLTGAAFYRNYDDTYPGLDAAEVLPVSHIVAEGRAYDLRWASGIDAVTSVLMSREVMNEYVLDPGTRSQTDWVLTFPTRGYAGTGTPPFVPETFHVVRDYHDREANVRREAPGDTCSFATSPCPPLSLQPVAGAFPVGHSAAARSLLGSREGLRLGEITGYDSGWMRARVADGPGQLGRLQSQPGSTMTDFATGAVTTGRFEIFGLPWVGFAVRTFNNGTLTCATGACQGNYAGSFPHRYVRSITLVP